MAKKCYSLTYVNCVGVGGTLYFCSESIIYHPSGGNCGSGWLESTDLGWNVNNASQRSASVSIASMSNCPGCANDPNIKCDCLNGACIPSVTYGTPGKYPTLTACEAGCAKDAACEGECVSYAELSALQQAAAIVISKLCSG
jgi:hypothetical protein